MNALVILIPDLPWACLMDDRALDALPGFKAMIEGGCAGRCAPVGPHPILDGVIATGQAPTCNGLLTRSQLRPDGFGVMPATADVFRVPTLWTRFDQAGLDSVVVNWRASADAHLRHGVVASDVFCEVSAHRAEHWSVPIGAVTPAARIEALAPLRLHPEELDVTTLGPFLAPPGGQRLDEAQARTIIKALAENVTAHALSTALFEPRPPALTLVRYPAMAQLRSGFPPPSPDRPGRGVAWGMLSLLDAFIVRWQQLCPGSGTIHVCGGTAAEPFWIASGPPIEPDTLWPAGTGLLDVAPTVLGLAGLTVEGLPGRVPANIRLPGEGRPVEHATVDTPALDWRHYAGSTRASDGAGAAARDMMARHAFRTRFALAEVALLEDRWSDAIDHYQAALELRPGDPKSLTGLGCARSRRGETTTD